MANPNLKMPYILPGQVQKHVTHEALRLLDAVVHLSVKSRNRAEAPEHLSVEIAISWLRLLPGAWAGKGGAIASFIDGGWLFVTPAIDWQAYVEDEAHLIVFDGPLWKDVS
ncbi:DUF2793 domain-containing protein [Brucella anthropi]|uniref:DUF2793 domain-containing protein n=1 Tax=Brucella anthropi TaxID=529 RepID=UPI00124C6E3D|nr:DUF2793 domain-containing protein [Brucella anthropi]KAB2770556.1 DUF2793 domain-containing protein [Brucella anthropi]WKT93353.1 DUF2793 domain-containing protein [Brucella anthropi]